jgi:hypothetical protein
MFGFKVAAQLSGFGLKAAVQLKACKATPARVACGLKVVAHFCKLRAATPSWKGLWVAGSDSGHAFLERCGFAGSDCARLAGWLQGPPHAWPWQGAPGLLVAPEPPCLAPAKDSRTH